jgi:PAS domain S-box-containing protein
VEYSIERATVLHVDDDPSFTDLVSEFLEREGEPLSVRSATSVDQALSKIRGAEIDAIVSDYEMPGKDGLEFLEIIRDTHPSLPFILFTGKGSEAIASKAISAGVTDYLQKETGTDQYKLLANRVLNSVRIHRAESAIERTEERYHNLVDTAPIPVLLFDSGGELVYANSRAVEFFDAESETELEGTRFTELLHPEDRKVSQERFEKLMEAEVSMPAKEYRLRTVDGEMKSGAVATAYGYYRDEKVAQAMIQS